MKWAAQLLVYCVRKPIFSDYHPLKLHPEQSLSLQSGFTCNAGDYEDVIPLALAFLCDFVTATPRGFGNAEVGPDRTSLAELTVPILCNKLSCIMTWDVEHRSISERFEWCESRCVIFLTGTKWWNVVKCWYGGYESRKRLKWVSARRACRLVWCILWEYDAPFNEFGSVSFCDPLPYQGWIRPLWQIQFGGQLLKEDIHSLPTVGRPCEQQGSHCHTDTFVTNNTTGRRACLLI